MTFRKDQAQIIAVCDFKPNDEDKVSGGIDLLDYRSTIRQLIVSAIARTVSELESSGDVLNIDGVNPYINARDEVLRIFGSEVNAGSGSRLFQDVSDLNELIEALTNIEENMDFMSAISEKSLTSLSSAVNNRKNSLLPVDPFLPYYINVSPLCVDFHNHVARALSESAGFSLENVSTFSSTKAFAQLLDLIGQLTNEGSSALLASSPSSSPTSLREADLNPWSFSTLDPYNVASSKNVYRLPHGVLYEDRGVLGFIYRVGDFKDIYGPPDEYDPTNSLLPFGFSYLDEPKYEAFSRYRIGGSGLGTEAPTMAKIMFALSRELSISSALQSYLLGGGTYIVQMLADENKDPNSQTHTPGFPVTKNRGLNLPGGGIGWLSGDSPFDRALINTFSAIDSVDDTDATKKPGPFSFVTSRVNIPEDPARSEKIYTQFESTNPTDSVSSAEGNRSLIQDFKGQDIPLARQESLQNDEIESLSTISALCSTVKTTKDAIGSYVDYIAKITSTDVIERDVSLDPVSVSNILLGNGKVQDVLNNLGSLDVRFEGPAFDIPRSGHTFDRFDFQQSYDIQDRIHTCLFAIDEPRFQSALEQYCFNYYARTRLSAVGPGRSSWFDFVEDSIESSTVSQLSNSINVVDFDTLPSGPLATGAGFSPKLPGVLAWSLLHFGPLEVQPELGEPDPTIFEFAAHDLYASLDYKGEQFSFFLPPGAAVQDMLSDDRHSPFEALASFFDSLMSNTAFRSLGFGSDTAWFNPVSVSSRRDVVAIGEVEATMASSLTGRELFFLCFQAFRRMIADSERAPRLIAVPSKGLSTYTQALAAEHPNSYTPGSYIDALPEGGLLSGFEDVLLPGNGVYFQIELPRQYINEGDRAEDASNASSSPAGATQFENFRREMEQENKAMLRALSIVGGIVDSADDSLQEALSKTLPPDDVSIVSEFLPLGAPQNEFGKGLLRDLSSETVSKIFKSSKATVSLNETAGDVSTSKAYLSLMKSVEGVAGVENAASGRLAALKSFLGSPFMTVSNDNRFDPTNARIFCVGFPSEIFDEKLLPTVSSDITSLELSRDQQNRDNTVVRVNFFKSDSLLKSVTFEGMSFIYDPMLFVAPEGYFNYVGSAPIEESLDGIKFHRSIVDVETGRKVKFQTYEFNSENGFVPTGEGVFDPPSCYLEDLSPEVARQLAYTTVTSDLLRMYVEIVNGLEISEDSFPKNEAVKEEILDLSVDSPLGINSIDFSRYIDVFTSLESFPLDSATAANLIDSESSGERTEKGITGSRLKTMFDGYTEGFIDDSNSSSFSVSRAILSSVLFSPNSVRQKILSASKLAGIGYFVVDPDQFRVFEFGDSSPGRDPDAVKSALESSSLIVSDPEVGEESTDFVVKSGNSEDATALHEINVTFTFSGLNSDPENVVGNPVFNGIPGDPIDSLGSS